MKQQPGITLELGDIEGVYSNLAVITHSPAEFIIDFARMMPGVDKAKVHARVIMTPQHAKLLLKALEDNIKKFEEKFGEIKFVDKPPTNIGFKKS